MSSNFLTHVVSLQATPLDTPKKRIIIQGPRWCTSQILSAHFARMAPLSSKRSWIWIWPGFIWFYVCVCMFLYVIWLSSERALAWGVMQQLRLSRGLWQSAHRWTDVSRQLRFHFPADPQTTISPSIGIPLMNICTIPANYARCNAVFFGVTSFLPKSMVILAL